MATLPNALSLETVEDGSEIIASEHRNNYSAVQTMANALLGILDDGASGQYFKSSGGTTVGWDYVGVQHRKTTAKDVVNTVTETDLLNGEVTVGAGVLGTTKTLHAVLYGDYYNNSGAGRTVQLKVKLGGTTIFDDTSGSITANAARRAWKLEVWITNVGAANSQVMHGRFDLSIATSPAAGIGDVSTNELNAPFGNNSLAIDTTAACAFAVTCIHSAADANLSMRLQSAYVEVL